MSFELENEILKAYNEYSEAVEWFDSLPQEFKSHLLEGENK